jgi:hypothetical protein
VGVRGRGDHHCICRWILDRSQSVSGSLIDRRDIATDQSKSRFIQVTNCPNAGREVRCDGSDKVGTPVAKADTIVRGFLVFIGLMFAGTYISWLI